LNLRNSLVSSALKLENIKENNVNFWLADTLTLVVKNIQRTHMSVLQGIVVMFWVIHYMSLVIGKDYELINNCAKCRRGLCLDPRHDVSKWARVKALLFVS